MKIEKFEDVEAWKKARELVKNIYQVTSKGKFFKDYSLRDQIRKAAVSIMANIAEGFARQSNPEFLKFLSYATASAAEVESHLYVALDQGYIKQEEFTELYSAVSEVAKLINAFMTYLRSHRGKRSQ